jgi:hypothetical protein
MERTKQPLLDPGTHIVYRDATAAYGLGNQVPVAQYQPNAAIAPLAGTSKMDQDTKQQCDAHADNCVASAPPDPAFSLHQQQQQQQPAYLQYPPPSYTADQQQQQQAPSTASLSYFSPSAQYDQYAPDHPTFSVGPPGAQPLQQHQSLPSDRRARRFVKPVRVGASLASASRYPGIWVGMALLFRVILNVVALIVFANAYGAVKLATTLIGVIVLSASAAMMVGDAFYILPLMRRDRAAVSSDGKRRTRQSLPCFSGALAISITQLLAMLATSLVATLSLASATLTQTEKNAEACAAIIANVHIVCDALVLGALVLDWMWTNHSIVLCNRADRVAASEVPHMQDPSGRFDSGDVAMVVTIPN